MKGAREHAAYSYTDIQHDLGLRPSSEFAWHGTLFADESLMGCDMTREQLGNVSHATSLYVLAFICGGRYQMEADYNAGEYSEELITQFLESYEMVLEGFLTHERLCDIDIASPSQTELLDSFTDDTIPLDKDATVVSMFRDCVEKYGDKVAVVYLDKKLTYNVRCAEGRLCLRASGPDLSQRAAELHDARRPGKISDCRRGPSRTRG